VNFKILLLFRAVMNKILSSGSSIKIRRRVDSNENFVPRHIKIEGIKPLSGLSPYYICSVFILRRKVSLEWDTNNPTAIRNVVMYGRTRVGAGTDGSLVSFRGMILLRNCLFF
jgi:hypothetical protein